MPKTFPGTTIEVTKIEKGSSRVLFDGIFAAGGITLSQVAVMTGLEPYMIQNWVKRGFVSSPVKRLYSKQQFARIIIINMLKESLQLEHICELIREIEGVISDPDDDLICDSELYHRYVDMLSEGISSLNDSEVSSAAEHATADFVQKQPSGKRRLERILQVMFYAHVAADMRRKAEEIFSTLK